MDMQIGFVILLAAIVLIILIKRFSRSRYGALRPCPETTEAYLSFKVNPQMKYYLSGSGVYPNAIIGIEKGWLLESDLWKPLNLDPDILKGLIFNINSLGPGVGALTGYEILDDRGGKIGDWLSLPGQNVTIWIRGENRFELSTPKNLYPQ